MANYHIRTFTSHISYNSGNYGYSDDNILQTYNEPALGAAAVYGIRTRPNTVFNTTAQELFLFYGALKNRQTPPPYSTMDADDILKLSTTDGYVYWSNWEMQGLGYGGYAAYNWDTNEGWSDPLTDNSTWLTEICTKFNTLKAGSEPSHDNNWNVYVFKYQFLNSPYEGTQTTLEWAYFPIFTKGNDPAYQTRIVI